MNIGFACIIDGFGDYTLRACRLANATQDRLEELTRENLAILLRMLQYVKDNNLSLFRIASDVIPFGSHPKVNYPWKINHKNDLEKIGKYIKANNIRVSMHPGQYTVLNSPSEDVAKRALADLEYHRDFLDSLGLDSTHKMVLHIGGAYGEKEKAIARFIARAKNLSPSIRSRLILENDDSVYSAGDVFSIGKIVGLPVVFDVLHHACNPSGNKTNQEWIALFGETWEEQDGTQKIHYSQQQEGGRLGAHSQSLDTKQWIKDSADYHGLAVMCEVKDKNISAIKCSQVHHGASQKEMEVTWARYKYLVLRYSGKVYHEIRKLFANPPVDVVAFYTLVDEALSKDVEAESVINSTNHIWGYFKDTESPNRYKSLVENLENGIDDEKKIIRYLNRLAKKHQTKYLLNSYSFYIW